MGATTIQWTDAVWNPTRGCSRVSPGCEHCYAEVMAARFSDEGMWGHGFAKRGKNGAQWTHRLALVGGDNLTMPLGWRTPRRVFVNSTSDLFHESLTDEQLDRVFAVMAICAMHETKPSHTFQILTKRQARMRRYMNTPLGELRSRLGRLAGQMMEDGDGWHDQVGYHMPWPLPNVWLGVSVENQQYADERVPALLDTPAAVRWVSYEPALGPVTFGAHLYGGGSIRWIVCGGESGPRARPFNQTWMRFTRDECRAAGVAFFAKQMGRWVLGDHAGFRVDNWLLEDGRGFVPPIIGENAHKRPAYAIGFSLWDKSGGTMEEWPEDLRVREWPGHAVP